MKYPRTASSPSSYQQQQQSFFGLTGNNPKSRLIAIIAMVLCILLVLSLPSLLLSDSHSSTHYSGEHKHEYSKPPPIKQDLYKEKSDNHHDDHQTEKPTVNPRVQVVRETEKIPLLRQLNKHYHIQRECIREKTTAAGGNAPYHVHTFFTMDCTDHSIWQAGTLEHSWEKVGQEGFLTRIISGCETAPHEKVQRTQRHFLKDEDVAEKRRGSFYAPYSSTLPSGRHYAPYNRPHSVYYWLKHADLELEQVFVMLDPDMVFMNVLPTEGVRLGHPVSQVYDYMENTPFEDYRCKSCPQQKFDRRPFAVGPPWMMHIEDWIRITPRWIQITAELADMYPTNWIVEMIAYSIACKVENLPHAWTYRAMVDNIDDAIVWDPKSDLLGLPAKDGSGQRVLPSTLHYCYTFEVGENNPAEHTKGFQHQRVVRKDGARGATSPVLDYYHFSKYRVPTDWPGGKARYARNFMSCNQPLLQEFHSIGTLLDNVFKNGPSEFGRVEIPKDDGTTEIQRISPQQFKMWTRSATMMKYLLPAINEAMTEYKMRYCEANERNLSKQLRTTHPSHFVSPWVLDGWDEAGRHVEFHRVG